MEKINESFKCLTGEYTIINYHHPETRKAIGEVRCEVLSFTTQEQMKEICQKMEKEIITNTEVKAVKETNDVELSVKITNEGELYKDFEKLIKPGKPKRLLIVEDLEILKKYLGLEN